MDLPGMNFTSMKMRSKYRLLRETALLFYA